MGSVLVVLLITMRWTKKNRTQKAAVMRQGYYQPVMIEEDIPLSGDGIFLKKCDYFQEDGHTAGQGLFLRCYRCSSHTIYQDWCKDERRLADLVV